MHIVCVVYVNCLATIAIINGLTQYICIINGIMSMVTKKSTNNKKLKEDKYEFCKMYKFKKKVLLKQKPKKSYHYYNKKIILNNTIKRTIFLNINKLLLIHACVYIYYTFEIKD